MTRHTAFFRGGGRRTMLLQQLETLFGPLTQPCSDFGHSVKDLDGGEGGPARGQGHKAHHILPVLVSRGGRATRLFTGRDVELLLLHHVEMRVHGEDAGMGA